MAKNKKKRKKEKPVGKIKDCRVTRFSKEVLLSELESQTRKLFYGMILPIEQRIESLFDLIQNVKSNVVVTNSLLERNKVISREDFFTEFTEYGKLESSGMVDTSGQMEGNSIFSIYNMNEMGEV